MIVQIGMVKEGRCFHVTYFMVIVPRPWRVGANVLCSVQRAMVAVASNGLATSFALLFQTKRELWGGINDVMNSAKYGTPDVIRV